MPDRPDFEAMTPDEITVYKAGLKDQINALHDDARAASVVQNRQIAEAHVEEARRSLGEWAAAHNMTLDEAADYWEGRLVPESGDPGRWIQANLVKGKPGKVPL